MGITKAGGAALCVVAILGLSGYGANASSSGARGSGMVPLPGAQAVREPAPCKGYRTYGVPRVSPLDARRTYKATVVTNKGTIVITLWAKDAPIAVQSFIFLAQHHYFDGVRFHRVMPGFVVQGGDPTGTGYCGPGYEFKDERVTHQYVRGVVAMANAGPNTNGSQFFIVVGKNISKSAGLPPSYTIFGQVTGGMSAVDSIARVPLGPSASGEVSAPRVKVYMKSVRITIK